MDEKPKDELKDCKKQCADAQKHNAFVRLKSLVEQLKPDSFGMLQEQMLSIIDRFQGYEESNGNCKSNGVTGKEAQGQFVRRKVFKQRESMLTLMLEVNHIKTIYNFFVALLILFGLNTLLYDYLETGRALFGVGTFTWAFGSLCRVAWTWLMMFLYTLLLYPIAMSCFCNRTTLAFPLYFVYLGIFSYFPLAEIRRYNLPPASTMIVVTEQVRLFMKIHSFVRENAAKYFTKKSDKQHSDPFHPTFEHFLYFLFAPTLIYRDHYPRTPHIRWRFVISSMFEAALSVLYFYYLLARFCVPAFKNTGKEPGSIRTMLLTSFSCMLPGTMILILMFYGVLHSWLNGFAELLRFGDRMFYRDWWNSTSYAAWYRNWNVVVHDWLFAYIYEEAKLLLGKRGRLLGVTLVFLLSAIVHEYILIVAFGFIFPALFITFGGLGLALVFLKPKSDSSQSSAAWNTFMWASLIAGNGLLMCLYSQEWYANMNCPRTAATFSDLLIPRSWNSDCVDWKWDIA